jgi:SAM-dependent methyltransferase
MKSPFTGLIKYAITKAKKSKMMQRLVEAPLEVEKMEGFAQFEDQYGNRHELKKGLRSRVKPGWERAINPTDKQSAMEDLVPSYLANGKAEWNRLHPIARSLGLGIKGASICEIGCHSGSAIAHAAAHGADSLTGTEFTGYKAAAVDREKTDGATLNEVSRELQNMRNAVLEKIPKGKKLQFEEDDICNSSLKDNSYDLIFSFDVLEHLSAPEKAFEHMARIVKPEGLIIHEYNPFYGLNGGHSACTLDFLWGHVRLNREDFEKYVKTYRPQEEKRALSFYYEGINRMSLSEMKNTVQKAGLELISYMPHIRQQHVNMMTHGIFEQSRKIYPQISFTDLVSPKVVIVLKRE